MPSCKPSWPNKSSHSKERDPYSPRSSAFEVREKTSLLKCHTKQADNVKDGGRGLENDITLEDFEQYISTINQQIEPYGYEIRSTHAQTSSTRSRMNRIYAFVNSVSDPQTQLATSHTPDEIAYVKRLLDLMFDTKNKQSREVMAVQSMDAIRLHKAPRDSLAATNGDTSMVDGDDGPQATQAPAQGGAASSITMGQAEALLESLVQEGWLQTSPAKFYALTPRALLELGGWLEDTYNDPNAEEGEWQPIKNCQACREIITVVSHCMASVTLSDGS